MKYGIEGKTVKAYLSDAGIDTDMYIPTESDIAEWVRLYTEESKSLVKIEEITGVPKSSLHRYLNKAGIDTSFSPQPEKTINEWIRLYENSSLSLSKIASLYGVSTKTVMNYLNKAGVDTSSYTHEKGRIYIIYYNTLPIYIGQTQYSIEHRLSSHIGNSHRRRGSFARFINDHGLTSNDLHISCLEDNISVKTLTRKEKKYIREFSMASDHTLLNDNYVYTST